MTSYEFFPFIKPSNEGKIVFPNYNTIMERQDVILPEVEQEQREPERPKASIDDLAIDFEKLKLSRGRQTKTSGGYKHEKLKELGKELKLRGFTIDFTSKDSLIDSIEMLN